METENKSHELYKNRDKNPAGPSTSGGKSWPDDKYPNFFCMIIIFSFPGIRPNFCLFVVPDLLKSCFSYLVNLPQILTPNLRQGQDPTPLPDIRTMNVHIG